MDTLARNLKYEEWLQMPTVQDGTDEVVNGELRFMPPTRLPHALIIQRLVARFSRQLDEKTVEILGSNFGLMISQEPLTCRSPDLALCWRDKMIIHDGLIWSPPELVIEVISPSENRRRKREKLDDYARIGVLEAWTVSPKARNIEIYRLSKGELRSVSIVDEGELHPIQFPAVSIPVAEIWPE